MTTKFEHLIINPLTRAPHNCTVNNRLITNQCYQNPESTDLHRVKKPPSMERIPRSQKIESMKKMMLMQEQLFKQQVEELHRLYNMQKKLMQETQKGLKQQKEKTADRSDSEFGIRHQTSTESNTKKSTFQETSARNDPITNEVISRSNSAENVFKFDLESTPSTSTHPLQDLKNKEEEGDVEVELTLSIGHCTRKRRSKSTDDDDEMTQLQDSHVGSSSSNALYQKNRRPHWLMQDLSLNRT